MGCCLNKSNKVADVVVVRANDRKPSEQPAKSNYSTDPIHKKHSQILKWKGYIEALNANSTIRNYCLSKSRADFQSLAELVAFFRKARARIATKDIELAWCIYLWVTHNIKYDGEGLKRKTYRDQSAEYVLKTGLSVCAGYANIYKHLCTENQIECRVVSGFAKGFGYKPGQMFDEKRPDHAWNAISVKNKW
jgi:transglutaminase/protease-like cytokinesis protein 3